MDFLAAILGFFRGALFVLIMDCLVYFVASINPKLKAEDSNTCRER